MLMWTAAMVLPFVAHSALPGAPWHSTARLAPWSVTRAESPKSSMVLHRDLSSSEPPATLMEPASDLAESVTQRLRRAFRFGKRAASARAPRRPRRRRADLLRAWQSARPHTILLIS